MVRRYDRYHTYLKILWYMKRCRFHFDISVQVSFRYQRLDLWRSRRWYRNEHCHFRKMNYPYFGRNGIWDTILTLDLILRNLFRERLVPGQLADGNTKIYIWFHLSYISTYVGWYKETIFDSISASAAIFVSISASAESLTTLNEL